MHRFELRIAAFAALALLLAQLGAMTHAYSHGVVDAASHQTGASSHDLCKDCLGYAPLLAATGAPGQLPALEPRGRGLAARTTATSVVDFSLTLAFRSRAPPFAS